MSWLVERLASPDPARKIRLGKIWAELRGVTAGPTGAQQAEIDNALTQVADAGDPWPAGPLGADRPGRGPVAGQIDIPAALGAEIGAALPGRVQRSTGGGGSSASLQGLLLGCAWSGSPGSSHCWSLKAAGAHGLPRCSATWYLLVSAVVVVAALAAGWLLARRCVTAVQVAAIRETEQLVADIGDRMAAVADEYVVAPAERELAELDRFRAELRIAAGRRAAGLASARRPRPGARRMLARAAPVRIRGRPQGGAASRGFPQPRAAGRRLTPARASLDT